MKIDHNDAMNVTTLTVRKTGTPHEVVVKFRGLDPEEESYNQRHMVNINGAKELLIELHKSLGDQTLRSSRSFSSLIHVVNADIPPAMKALLGEKLAGLPIDISLGMTAPTIGIDFGKREITPEDKLAVLDFLAKHEEGLMSEITLAKRDKRFAVAPSPSAPPVNNR